MTEDSSDSALPTAEQLGISLTDRGRLLLVSDWDHSLIGVVSEDCSLAEAFVLAPEPHHERDGMKDQHLAMCAKDAGGCAVFEPHGEMRAWQTHRPDDPPEHWYWYCDDLAVHYWPDRDGPEAVFYLDHRDSEFLCVCPDGTTADWYPAD